MIDAKRQSLMDKLGSKLVPSQPLCNQMGGMLQPYMTLMLLVVAIGILAGSNVVRWLGYCGFAFPLLFDFGWLLLENLWCTAFRVRMTFEVLSIQDLDDLDKRVRRIDWVAGTDHITYIFGGKVRSHTVDGQTTYSVRIDFNGRALHQLDIRPHDAISTLDAIDAILQQREEWDAWNPVWQKVCPILDGYRA